jgi:hypothetical protein
LNDLLTKLVAMRKLLCLLIAALSFSGISQAQVPVLNPSPSVPDGYWIEVEEFAVHEGMVGTVDLAGFTTYRIYLNMVNEHDFLSTISGEFGNPLILNSTSDYAWFNDLDLGVDIGAENNSGFFGFLPQLAFDSWLTIGGESSGDGIDVSAAEGDISLFDEFNSGGNVLIDDPTGSALFTLYPCDAEDLSSCDWSHPSFAGDDLRVLVGQVTTQGELTGQMQIQVFGNGNADEEWRGVIPLTPFVPPVVVDGCMDVLACNFDPLATNEDGTCDYCSCAISEMVALDYSMSVEVHAVDVIPGMTTYRLYMNLANSDDFLSSIFGDSSGPLSLSTTTGFYNSEFGGTTAGAINPAFYGFFPDLQGDSWVTIGIDSQPVGAESEISTVESIDQPWI